MHLPFLCSSEAARFSKPKAGGQAAINSQRQALFRGKRGRGDPFAPAWDPCREGILSFPGLPEGGCSLQSQRGESGLNVNT